MMDEEYRTLLGRIDEWYRGVQETFPDKVVCRIGCRDCCLGLFEISAADRDVLREGLAGLDASARGDIVRRAREIVERLRRFYPELGATLEGLSEAEIEEVLTMLGPVECPVLGPQNECRLYAHRPLVCRLAGVPVVDLSGEAVHAEGCSKCLLSVSDAPRIDYRALRAAEIRILRRLHPGLADATLTIPQALSD